MKLALYVHDFHMEIGHTNAMVEVLRHWQGEPIEELVVVAFTFSPKEKMLPELGERLSYCQVPVAGIKPFILKVIWYQWWAWLIQRSSLNGFYHMGIGTAAFGVDLVNVQFVHSQWQQQYLQLQRQAGLGRWLYKKVLYAYLTWCERHLYRRSGIKMACCARFIQQFVQQAFGPKNDHVATAYSGVNLQRFSPSGKSRSELFQTLQADYPQLIGLDLSRPIALFVGAYERKGLPQILASRPEDLQLIIVGQSELARDRYQGADRPPGPVFFIRHTREIAKFYDLADAFLFPSLYDPFALVVLEAAAMGLQIFVSQENVGASELLQQMDEIYLLPVNQALPFQQIKRLPAERREQLRRERLQHLAGHSWQAAAEVYAALMK